MSTSSQAKILAATNQCNINLQRRTDKLDDLIHFESRKYDDAYASPIYPNYTVRPTTPILIYYDIQLDKKKVDDDHMVITNPDDILVLSLHNIVTDN
ncbi:2593_t:CDS:1, partial [Gigaspora margarita]